MSFKLSNYGKNTPGKWQVIGDLALVLIPVLIGVVQNSPLEVEVQTNVIFYMSSILAVIKVLTQFFTQDEA